MERIGLVGLPNSGKSSLFNALTGGSAPVASHPFSTTESSVGVAQVPDQRLDALAAMSSSRKVVHAGVELVDIAGLVAGSSTGEGLGNRFLGGIREADAICLVLRAFADDNVPGGSDPIDDLGVLELELVLADLASAEVQLERRRKAAKQDHSLDAQVAALDRALQLLADGIPIYRSGMGSEDRELLQPFFLLTNKPVMAVVNLGEDSAAGDDSELAKPVADELGGASEVLGLSVKLEAEAAQLAPADRDELMEGLGLGEGALPRVAQAAYRLLGRRTFLTTGDKESRAWTFRAGAKAPECAGVIHSDLQRGFIRAEVIHWDELLKLGSWSQGQRSGQVTGRGQRLRSRRWRRPRDPLQRLSRRRRRGRLRRRPGAGWSWWPRPSATWGTCRPGPPRPWPSAGYIYCEDTRRTLKLLNHASIKGPRLVSHHRFNEASSTPVALARLAEGACIALVSDAGTPLVSDPGGRLVRAAVAAGVPVGTVPGPSAALAALVVSGLATERWCFEGFLPRTGRQRAERLAAVASDIERGIGGLRVALPVGQGAVRPDGHVRAGTPGGRVPGADQGPRGDLEGQPVRGVGPLAAAHAPGRICTWSSARRHPGNLWPVARFYVTTPIYYVNDAPHIGHAYTTVTADALARWHRLVGDEVFFLTGTDEHGLKVKRSAEANGLTPQEQVDRYSARFQESWQLLDISYDDFIRTTEPRHHRAVSALMQAVYDNGWIARGVYEGLYCVACEAYYTEDDLVDGLCPVHHRPVELLKEDNYFFRLSAFTDRSCEWYADNPGAVAPEAKRNEALGLVGAGCRTFP